MTTTATPSAYFTFHPQLQKNIVSLLGWRSLRPVQEQAAPPLMAGHDALILAPTAGGKTESAALPLLNRVLTENRQKGPSLLYLCPLKALLNNLLPRLELLARAIGRRAFCWHGEVTQGQRKKFLAEPATILLTTPESLQVMLTRRNLDSSELFGDLMSVVVDEVHAFCGQSRGDQLSALLHQLDTITSQPVQRVGLSATVGNPEQLLDWLSGDRGVEKVLIDPSEASKRPKLLEVHPIGSEPEACSRVLAYSMKRSAKNLLFVNSRREAELYQSALQSHDIDALAHHSSLSKDVREQTEAAFRKDKGNARRSQTIVCTSTLELGLDVGDIDRVYQLGAPNTVSAFLQRLGRAGRRQDSPAHMVFVTDTDDTFLRAVSLIQLAVNKQVEPVIPNDRSFCVLAQQILLTLLKAGSLYPGDLWQRMGTASAFAAISSDERRHLLEHLVQEEWLIGLDGRIGLGPRTEEEYGRGNYLDLISVFNAGAAATIKTSSGQVVGNVDFSSAATLYQEGRSFLLGGKSWKAKAWNSRTKILTVVGSAGGAPVRWNGTKIEVDFPIVRQMKSLLTGSEPCRFLSQTSQDRLAQLRSDFSHLEEGVAHLKATKTKVHVEQWAGAKIHRTLGAMASGWLGTDFQYDERRWVLTASRTQWNDLFSRTDLAPTELIDSGLKLYRGKHLPSPGAFKFEELLPPEFLQELIWRDWYDVAGAAQVWNELLHCPER